MISIDKELEKTRNENLILSQKLNECQNEVFIYKEKNRLNDKIIKALIIDKNKVQV